MIKTTKSGSSLEGREDGATWLLTITSATAPVLINMTTVIKPVGKLRHRTLLRVSW